MCAKKRYVYTCNSCFLLHSLPLVSQAGPSHGKRGSGDTAIVELCRMSPVLGGHISGAMITLRNVD